MALVVNCPYGHTLSGRDDPELFVLAKSIPKRRRDAAARDADGARCAK